jgi:hypothetical protein
MVFTPLWHQTRGHKAGEMVERYVAVQECDASKVT